MCIRDRLDQVLRLTALALSNGCKGVVASAHEAGALRHEFGREFGDFAIVTPGVRPAGSGHDDQARVVTPAEAIAAGSSHIVVDVYKRQHLDMANLLILSRRLPEAREHLDLLVQKQPNNPEVYLARASYDAAANNTAAALADMQKALQLDPARSDSYLSLAMLQMQGQQWDAAEASFKKAVDLNPKSASSLLALGNFYQTRGRFPEAEQMFHRAIDAAHDEPGPRLSLASLYMAENKPAQAEDFLRQAKKDFPSNSVGYRMLGDFYYANNQLDKATDEYAGLYKDHRNDMLVKKNYIQLLILKDRTDEARKLDDEILKEHPDDEDAQISVSYTHLDVYKRQRWSRSSVASSPVG